jgi:hypothetical protein
VATYALDHRHAPTECGVAFAAWRCFDSPLRALPVLASCASDGHRMLWTVEAPDGPAALELLPPWVARRTEVERMWEVGLP